MIAALAARFRRAFSPPRASWSYRYHLAGDTPGTGPISAIYVMVAMDHRARNHALAEGAPDPSRGAEIDPTPETASGDTPSF